jgi:extracellular elastinolytic metalloproteinase
MRSLVALGLLGAAATVGAHPSPSKGTRGLRKRTVSLESFRLKATADYINQTVVAGQPAPRRAGTDYVATATALVKSIAPKSEFRVVDDHYVGTNGIAHVHFKQTANGLDIDNADFNVNVCSSLPLT